MSKIRRRGKVYISGPMTGIPNLNADAFAAAAKRLRNRGYKVISPPEQDRLTFGALEDSGNESDTWKRCLRRDLRDLLDCSCIHLLSGWQRSKGATLEMMVAKEIGLKFVDDRGREVPPVNGPHESILLEAERITNGPRRSSYGHPLDNFTRTADLWAPILGKAVTAHQVGLCMVVAKVARECNTHTRDNLVDIAGYANATYMTLTETEARKTAAFQDRASQ